MLAVLPADLIDDTNGYDFVNNKGAVFTATDSDAHGGWQLQGALVQY